PFFIGFSLGRRLDSLGLLKTASRPAFENRPAKARPKVSCSQVSYCISLVYLARPQRRPELSYRRLSNWPGGEANVGELRSTKQTMEDCPAMVARYLPPNVETVSFLKVIRYLSQTGRGSGYGFQTNRTSGRAARPLTGSGGCA